MIQEVESESMTINKMKTGFRDLIIERFKARLNYDDVGKYKMSLTNTGRTGRAR